MDVVTYWQQTVGAFLRARFGRTERGASLVEYALLVALIAIVCVLAIAFFGTSVSNKYSITGSMLS